MIRGILCEQCNSKLATYEHKGVKESSKDCYKEWVKSYKPAIEEHLKRTTRFKYSNTKKVKMKKLWKELNPSGGGSPLGDNKTDTPSNDINPATNSVEVVRLPLPAEGVPFL
jgi:hypothetical protein